MKVFKFSAVMLLLILFFGIGCQKSEINTDIKKKEVNISPVSNRSLKDGDLKLENAELPRFLIDRILRYDELSAKVGGLSFKDRWGGIDMEKRLYFGDKKGEFVRIYFVEQEDLPKHLLITTQYKDGTSVYIISENDEVTLNAKNREQRINMKLLLEEMETSSNSSDEFSSGCYTIIICDSCPLGWGLVEVPCVTNWHDGLPIGTEGGVSSWGGSWFGDGTFSGSTSYSDSGNDDCGGGSGWVAENSDNDFDEAIRILQIQYMQIELGFNNCAAEWLYDNSSNQCDAACSFSNLLDADNEIPDPDLPLKPSSFDFIPVGPSNNYQTCGVKDIDLDFYYETPSNYGKFQVYFSTIYFEVPRIRLSGAGVSEAEATAVCIAAVEFAESKIELKYRYSSTHPIITAVEIDYLYYLNLSLAPFGARATKQSNYGAVPVRQAHYW